MLRLDRRPSGYDSTMCANAAMWRLPSSTPIVNSTEAFDDISEARA